VGKSGGEPDFPSPHSNPIIFILLARRASHGAGHILADTCGPMPPFSGRRTANPAEQAEPREFGPAEPTHAAFASMMDSRTVDSTRPAYTLAGPAPVSDHRTTTASVNDCLSSPDKQHLGNIGGAILHLAFSDAANVPTRPRKTRNSPGHGPHFQRRSSQLGDSGS
jgi:hypothetical protein